MKYTVKQDKNQILLKSLKDVVLENRGLTVEECNFLINPTDEYLEFPEAIPNMKEASELFIEQVNSDCKIGILADADCDGITSTVLMHKFLTNECHVPYDDIEIFYHSGKLHGLEENVLKNILKSHCEFIIIPDAGVNNIEEMKKLINHNKKFLLLDHHQPNDKDMKTIYKDKNDKVVGVVVDNQFGDRSTCFSGVGVCWKFISYLMEDNMEDYLDIVAIGNIADVMDINNNELRYIVNKGLKNINNNFIKYALKDFDINNITPTIISFNVANLINAVTRFGTVEDNQNLVKALIDVDEYIKYKPKKSKNNPNPIEINQTLSEAMVRISKSIKQKQDRVKKECIKKCKEYIDKNNLNDGKVLVVIDEDESFIDKRLTGLIATNLVSEYKKPVVLLGVSKTKDKITGSMRSYGNIDDFKSILESTGILEVIGHNSSAGVFAEYKDKNRIKKRIERAMENVEVKEALLEVDCELDINNINKNELKDILDMEIIWNSHCKKPLFVFKDIELDSSKVKSPIGNLMTFEINGFLFKKEYCSKVFKEEFLHKEIKWGHPKLNCDYLICEIGYDDYKKQPCFKIQYAKTSVIDIKKDRGVPF